MCTPGQVRCGGQDVLEECAPTGLKWVPNSCPELAHCVVCPPFDETCTSDHCEGPCDSKDTLPSSAGCSFIANRQLHPYEDFPDGVIIGNPNTKATATVSVYKIPEGMRKEQLVDGFPIKLAPGKAVPYEINTSFVMGLDSMFRTGGMFRIESDVPVIAYQHSPFQNNRGNDSSLLLPENVLGQDYVVASYNPSPIAGNTDHGRPSYFEIIALVDGTTVQWTPPFATQGNGLPIPPVAAGETGSIQMNRFDTMRVTASDADDSVPEWQRDISGTVIHADNPIWVVGATRCGVAPAPPLYVSSTCDPMQELLFPLRHWGKKYVAIAPPPRNDEWTHWRIYAAKGGVTVTSDPPLADFPHTFDARGEFIDVSVPPNTPFILESDAGPFLPVMQLQARYVYVYDDDTKSSQSLYSGGSTTNGDPSMVQMVPVEQFLSRYVFMTGVGFGFNWAVFIRQQGNALVRFDGVPVTGWTPVGDFEIARVPVLNAVEDGTDSHLAESDDPFGLIQIGYSSNVSKGMPGADGCIDPLGPGYFCDSSYAYPGGMKSEVIFTP